MMHIYIIVMILVLVNTTYQQNIGSEREFCKAVQTSDILEKALPLIRRHLEAETQSCRRQMDEVNAKLRAVQVELETTKRRNNDMNVSLEAVQAELEYTKKIALQMQGLKGLKSCSELMPGTPSGVYTVILTPGRNDDVYCDMDTAGGPWTVIQNRQDGTVDFNRNWTEYQTGFGDLDGEFWAGLNIINLLTQNGTILRINLMSWENDTKYAEYQDFRVWGESSEYRLSVSGFSGNVSDDWMTYSNGQPFTFDNDVVRGDADCTVRHHGAWWYKGCSSGNLNGRYVQDTGKSDYQSMYWYRFNSGRAYAVPLMKSRMMVKHPAF